MTALGPNQPGPQGDTGAAGEDFGVDYLYESTVGSGNPGSGKVALDNADHSLATILTISETDANSTNVAGWLGTFDDSTSATKGQLFVRAAADPTIVRVFSVTSATDSGTYWSLGISLLTQNGTLSDADPIKVAFLATGDKGQTGAAGSNGSNGSNGADGRDAGINYKFNTATSGDPGSGKVLFNHATLSSATALNISETDDDGGSLSALLATWDDGTSTIRGKLLLRKVGTPASFAEFTISGTLTDNGTYDTFTASHVASGGSFSNNDELMLIFVPKGDKGDTGAAGSNGSNGSNGTDGRDAGWNYKFNTATAGDPGSGKLLFDNATLSSASTVSISETDDDGNAIALVLALWASGLPATAGYLTIKKVGAPTTFAVFGLGAFADIGSFRAATCNHIVSSGTFSNNDECIVSFSLAGIAAPVAQPGWNYQWNTNTSTGDPGSGKLKVNNSTLSSATTLRISETDDDGNGIAAIIATWDDAPQPTRGYVTVRKVGAPTTFVEYGLTSALTDQGSYDEFTISHVASSGTFSNNDETMVSFRPATEAKHYAEVVRAAAQTGIVTATPTMVLFDAETQDNGSLASVGTPTATPITIARAGRYIVSVQFAHTASDVVAALFLNGAVNWRCTGETVNGVAYAQASRVMFLAANDTLGLQITHVAGSNQDTLTQITNRPSIAVAEL